MLFLHGLDGPSLQAEFFQRLASKFRVIIPTHPGFGGSSVPAEIDSVDDLAYLYLELLEELNAQGHRATGIHARYRPHRVHVLGRVVKAASSGLTVSLPDGRLFKLNSGSQSRARTASARP